MTEGWLIRIVDEFWAAADDVEPFPRHLEKPVLWALPLAVLKVPRLWVRDVEAWLERHDVPIRLRCADRPLQACLIAYKGKGAVLLSGIDLEDERRFSLAHEVAHFLLDYLLPRQRALRQIGEGILEVLDGLRPPTLDERVNALLSDTPLGVHTHLMDRHANGNVVSSFIAAAERQADRLALELLAPAAEVQRRVFCGEPPSAFEEGAKRTADILTDDFGLPRSIAEMYGKWLWRSWHPTPSFQEWLGL